MKKTILLSFLFFFTATTILAQLGTNDPTFNTFDDGDFGDGSGFNAQVYSLAVQSDSKIIVGGNFVTFNGTASNRIARLNVDGSLDVGFNIGSGFNGLVMSVAYQSDGKIIVGGDFTNYNGTARNRIARLNADGSLDLSFNPGSGFNTIVRSIAIQSDGKIIVGGSFTIFNGTARNYIARLNTDGSSDTDFNIGTGFNSWVRSIAIQSDGKIVVGGEFATFNGIGRNRIARLNDDGTLDIVFSPGTGFNAVVNSVGIKSDGKIVAGGDFTSYNGTGRLRIACINTDGLLDTGFDPGLGLDNAVNAIVIQSDNKILVGGHFTAFNGNGANRIARIEEDGLIDNDFNIGTGFNFTVFAIANQIGGKIIVGGDFTSINGIPRNRIACLNTDGSKDIDFIHGVGFNDVVYTVAYQSDGKIVVGGDFTTFNGTSMNYIARLNNDGSLDPSFDVGDGFNSTVYSVVIQDDGKIIVGGNFLTFNGTSRSRITRLNIDGSVDTSFDPGTGFVGSVRSIAIQNDGNIMVGGSFTSFNGVDRNRIARLHSDGTLDTSFDPGTGFNNTIVYSVAIQSDSRIMVGGNFTTFNEIARNRIARLHSDGTLDTSFDPGTGVGGPVYTVAIQSDNKIIIGGNFLSFNGVTRFRIARLNTDGSLDNSFNIGTGFNAWINSIVIQNDGKVITGGSFATFNGVGRNRIARLHTNGSLDTGFNPGTGFNNQVWSMAIQSDDKILVGGQFTQFNTIWRNRIARLEGACAASYGTDVQEHCDTYTWIDGVTYTTSNNTATHLLTSATGCDSLVTLDLTINLSTSGTDVQEHCDTYTWIDGITYTSSNNTATYLLTNAIGCDSLVTLDLTINLSTTGTDVVTECESYTWIDGITYSSSNNTATHLLTNAAGCDSLVTLDLTINYSNSGTDVITECDSYTWIDGITYSSSNNTATHLLTNASGCDSLVTLDLTINYSNSGTDIITECDSYTWIDGITYSSSNNTATHLLTNASGCDSLVTLDLTINYSSSGTDVITECDSYTWIDGITYSSSNNTATHLLTNAVGCDSLVTLDLTINYSNSETDVITECDSYTWIDGITYTASNNTATHLLTNAVGCDSLVTLDLTINYSNSGTDVQEHCDTYTWIDGITYTTSNNTATYLLTNATGCDSIVTLNLTINYPTTGTDVLTECDSYTWIDGITYTTSNNTATHLLTSSAGCDSLVTLDLTINYSTTGTDAITECDSYTWIDGITYSSSNNTATHLLTNAAGCDSLVTLDLTINFSTTSTDVIETCDSYTWIDGNTYSASNNTATFTLSNASGCDSLITLDLTIPSLDVTVANNSNVLTVNEAGATYQWVDCNEGNQAIAGETSQSFTPTLNGSYAVEVTVNNCTETSACVEVSTLGLAEGNSKMSVYPNPVNDVLIIEHSDFKPFTFEIVNALGQIVLTSQLRSEKTIIDINYLQPGLYLLRVGEENMNFFKIIKE